MKIKKKILPKYFQKIMEGTKKFELRLADWQCNQGDILVLREWDPDKKEYTGQELEKEVTYILKTKDVAFWSKEEIDRYGFQIILFE